MARGLAMIVGLTLAGSLVHALPAAATPGEVKVLPARFEVLNVNRTALPCGSAPDGGRYVLEGEIVGPANVLGRRRARSATLYLHGAAYARVLWRFDAVPGYDFAAELARAAHVSVVIDRLGYGASPTPAGTATCTGSQADMGAQVLKQLKSGRYELAGRDPIRFRRVAIGGLSSGALEAEAAAAAFPDRPDGLVILSYVDAAIAPGLVVAVGPHLARTCAAGGEPKQPGGPPGYVFTFPTDAIAGRFLFASTEPAVRAAAAALDERDPCGDQTSVPPFAYASLALSAGIRVPVLTVVGDRDRIIVPRLAGPLSARFVSSPDVRTIVIPGAGHALVLDRQAQAVQRTVAEWLTSHGL